MKKTPIALLCLLAFDPVFAAALPADTGINWTITPDQVKSICESSIATAQAQIKSIEAQQGPVTFDSGLGAIELATAVLSDDTIAPQQLANFAVSKDVRDASNACLEKFSTFNVQLAADPIVYHYALDIYAHPGNADQKELAKLYVETGRRAGAALSPQRRQQVTKLLDEINDLQIAFNKQLADDQPTIEISKAEAESLPPAFVQRLKATDTGYTVPVNESTVEAFQSNEASGDARHRYAVAFGRHGGDSNVERLRHTVELRDQVAHLIGYKNWDEYQLSVEMAKTPKRALDLLKEVDDASLPKARDEIAVLAKLKADSGDAGPFQAWDYAYYERMLEKSKYSVDNEAVRQYFPVDKVVPAVFAIYEKLLSVKFEPIVPAMAWAPEVTEYDIVDAKSGAPIAWFYLDLYPRDGKYTHFATFPFRSGRVLPDGSYQKPVGAVIGNWTAPSAGKPALLSHDEVVTFFHEFGHLMHDTLTRAPYETYAGTNVRHDFVEAPSQMLENWMWQPAILKEVSSNVSTGQPLPDDLIERMVALKHVHDGMTWSQQAFYGTYDLDLHGGGKPQPTKLWFDLKARMTVFPALPGTIPEAGFGHLMSGYDAGYYGYLWSLVYAQDMFTKFKEGGLESPEVGARYRSIILEKGGSVEPDELLSQFLGRPVDISAFDDYIGLNRKK